MDEVDDISGGSGICRIEEVSDSGEGREKTRPLMTKPLISSLEIFTSQDTKIPLVLMTDVLVSQDPMSDIARHLTRMESEDK